MMLEKEGKKQTDASRVGTDPLANSLAHEILPSGTGQAFQSLGVWPDALSTKRE